MGQHRSRYARSGFTLIELLVAIAILSVGLIGVSQLYMAAVWSTQKAGNLAVASERVQRELETVTALGYAGLTTDPLIDPARFPADEYSALTDGRGVQFTENRLPGSTGTIRITSLPDNPGLLYVTIELQWEGAPKAQCDVRLFTLVSETSDPGGAT